MLSNCSFLRQILVWESAYILFWVLIIVNNNLPWYLVSFKQYDALSWLQLQHHKGLPKIYKILHVVLKYLRRIIKLAIVYIRLGQTCESDKWGSKNIYDSLLIQLSLFCTFIILCFAKNIILEHYNLQLKFQKKKSIGLLFIMQMKHIYNCLFVRYTKFRFGCLLVLVMMFFFNIAIIIIAQRNIVVGWKNSILYKIELFSTTTRNK